MASDILIRSPSSLDLSDSLSELSIQLNPPHPQKLPLCCGHHLNICSSTKLHSIVFLLAGILMIYYFIVTFGAWGAFIQFTYRELSLSNPFLHLCLSVTLRLISTIFLMAAAITRKNIWITWYFLGNGLSLIFFVVGTVLIGKLVWLASILPFMTDVAIQRILKHFQNETLLLPIRLAEKLKLYAQTMGNKSSADDTDNDFGLESRSNSNEAIRKS